MADELKTFVDAVQGISGVISGIRGIISNSAGRAGDPLTADLAAKYATVTAKLDEFAATRPPPDAAGQLRASLVKAAEELEEAAATDATAAGRVQKRTQAIAIRQQIVALDVDTMLDFSTVFSNEDVTEFVNALGEAKAAVAERRAMKATLDSLAKLAVASAKLAAKAAAAA